MEIAHLEKRSTMFKTLLCFVWSVVWSPDTQSNDISAKGRDTTGEGVIIGTGVCATGNVGKLEQRL
jgi:hypothetical protein